LQEAIRAARAVLLIASPEARSSRHVQETLQIARIYRSRVCTVLIDGEDWQECVPKDSGEFFAMIDARKKNDDQVFDEIIVALGGDRLTRSMTEELAELLIERRNPFKDLSSRMVPSAPTSIDRTDSCHNASRWWARIATLVD